MGKAAENGSNDKALTQFDSSVFIYYEIFSEFSPLQLIGWRFFFVPVSVHLLGF